MSYLKRQLSDYLKTVIERGKGILLLGPRQTGKTTLIKQLPAARYISFADPRVRLRYEMNPGALIDEIEALPATSPTPLIVIDEVQKVPLIMDAVQYLMDNQTAQFLLTGSSARKLKRHDQINLLPGRVIPLHLDPLMLSEIPQQQRLIKDLLLFGSLPEIILTEEPQQREELLESYVMIYLEEEVRAEALVRELASFAKFLELAASEAGYINNMSKLSQVIGVASSTIESYYQILEDCLIVERIEPYTLSKTRHRLSRASKYLFFDLGVRRLAAREGMRLPEKYMGHLFEQFVGIELVRLARLQQQRTRIMYWSDKNGPEVDWLVESPDGLIPIEVKWSDMPSKRDARHLLLFLEEYPEAKQAYIVCQTPHKMKISDRVYAIPWQTLEEIFFTNS